MNRSSRGCVYAVMATSRLTLVLFALLTSLVPLSNADDDPVANARAFVEKCLRDKSVFVLNPPADKNPYRDLSPKERYEQVLKCAQDGSILVLYPNGIPERFESKKNDQEHGRSKT